jgi:hypothetical protein
VDECPKCNILVEDELEDLNISSEDDYYFGKTRALYANDNTRCSRCTIKFSNNICSSDGCGKYHARESSGRPGICSDCSKKLDEVINTY